ncbi:Ribonucleoside-diphosphate reductase large subunit [Camponotus floridanus]|uniref:Ribonucleoside-diphosphate reductase n=2 Tax=Camponotus floridanus TaxID=104421 RepID=E2AXG0_CAMFO|nr:ribonucleoside-diphosphate reductase large subunit isoform X1 [Camponotus floridanus]XP_025270733.1 ribonucleoside-diphosphate reductase large subunit isoform X1 [Camponotus floridanus]XP_025270734.1 ribonucleoside-diphosphate reductase large subunit isoform X1 [Camponotus floridanus]EFN61884.1 Ribonucleoside-diphosphate reductase large subunit [Camponotus floridanus]
MHVLKRDGRKEPVHFDEITARIKTLCYDLDMNYVDPSIIALRVITDLYSGVTTVELDNLASEIAASMINQHPDYAILAARIAISNLHKETKKTFSEVIADLYDAKNSITNKRLPIISEKYYKIIQSNADKLNSAIIYDRDFNYSYTTYKMLETNHLLKLNGKVVERPQHMLMRVAIAIHDDDIDKAIETYNFLSKQYFIYPAQTLDTACTVTQQMASSFLLTMSGDSIDGILDTLERSAVLCHYNGDIGFNVHCIRAKNTPIRGTGGVSNGLVPMLKAYNTSIATVSRKNTEQVTVYLEPWHADIFEFLDLKKNIGEEKLRAKDMFYALWTPDLFMQRIFNDDVWSLMCPHECPDLIEAYGEEFELLYTRYEKEGRFRKQIKARDLWLLIIQTQFETGTPYIVYKDHCNRKTNHQNLGTIKCSGFSTEIIQYSSSDEIAMCNTASIAVNMFVDPIKKTFDFNKLKEIVKIVTYNLDKMIDANFYPLPEIKLSCEKHRSIGIGVQGLADAFILMRYPFESQEARKLNIQIFETLYYGALEASCEIAIKKGSYVSYKGSPISKGMLQYDMWNAKPTDLWDWNTLKKKIEEHGVRNSLLIAQMSDAFMAQMLENNVSVEPYTSNIYVIHALSKQFRIVKPRLLRDLIEKKLWDENICNKIINNDGSIQNIEDIPNELKLLYKTAWEMPQKTIFDMAACRGPFIDQSQCLNVHMIDPLEKLTSMHFYAWENGLKSSICHVIISGSETE